MDHERVEFVEILKTSNPGDIAFIKSLFDANGIVYHMEGENFLQVHPLVAPVRVKVDQKDAEDARELLKDFQSGRFGYDLEP